MLCRAPSIRYDGKSYLQHIALRSCQPCMYHHSFTAPTNGSTSFTPLSWGGLWEAVIITPIHLPFRARDRRAAMRPTRVRTESRTSLLRSVFKLRSWIRTGGSNGEPYALVRNYAEIQSVSLWMDTWRCSTYTSSSVSVNKPFRRRVLLRSVGDGVRHDGEW